MTEEVVPDVRLTRSKDGANGTATFVFNQPSVFEASSEFGDITGLYMLDDEGEILTVEVSAKFVNGKPDRIEAIHIMRSPGEWDRFMRFMERYSEDKGLGFQKVNSTHNLCSVCSCAHCFLCILYAVMRSNHDPVGAHACVHGSMLTH